MPLITLLSDMGTSDHYVATVKGRLYTKLPQVNIVDISHQIARDSIIDAAFVLRNAFPHFPDGTIHLISVRAPLTFENPYVAIKVKNQYFIGTDTGIFSLAFEGYEIQGIIGLENIVNEDNILSSHPMRDIFVDAAVALCTGTSFLELGEPRPQITQQFALSAGISGNVITGSVLYSDSFGNAITNLTKSFLLNHLKGKKFVIEMRSRRYNITDFKRFYNDVALGDILALFNSSDLLEIAINQGSVKDLIGLKAGDVVKISIAND